MSWKLGSLFDGSGGFPLAGSLCDIEPRWASEVEPYPIAVTRSRFPNMKHLGDISKVNGAEVEPVDIITFGSPCQDLSVAGKRAGLKHEANGDEETTRSGLFMEAVRIIKEMREATNGEYPRFALWENVPGAFSSNKGEDFRIVLEELIKIIEPTAVMPAVPKNGWAYADSYVGNGWSIAYRVFDAQYWGVPQRRRRIHLIADFRGTSAREVLFEREGVRGYFAKGGTAWESLAAYAEGSVGADHREGECAENPPLTVYGIDHAITTGGNCTAQGPCVYENTQATLKASGPHSVAYTLKIRSGCEGGGKGALVQTDKSATLATNNDQYLFQPVPDLLLDDQGGQQVNVRTDGKCPTLRAEAHGNVPAVLEQHLFENHSQDSRYRGPLEVCPMLPAQLGTGGNNQPFVVEREPVCYNGENITSPLNKTNPQPGEPCHTLGTDSRNYVVYCLQGNTVDRDAKQNGSGMSEDVTHTLNSVDRHAVAYAMQGFGDYKESDVASGLKARDYKDATDLVTETPPIAIDRAFYNQGQNALYDPQFYEDGTVPTIVARGPSAVAIRYIVRRLTPTECARLQGFADCWGHIEEKDDFTEEDYRFWLDVRNTHAEINGKVVKDYTKKQMLTWYNKLHADSAEYKMWGNGIALPPALYCMQGITDVLERERR